MISGLLISFVFSSRHFHFIYFVLNANVCACAFAFAVLSQFSVAFVLSTISHLVILLRHQQNPRALFIIAFSSAFFIRLSAIEILKNRFRERSFDCRKFILKKSRPK